MGPSHIVSLYSFGVMAPRRDPLVVKLVLARDGAVSPMQVFSLLKSKGISVPGDIDLLQSLQARNTFDLRFRSVGARDQGLLKLKGVDGLTVTPYDASVWITVLYVESEVGQELVASVLSRYGDVLERRLCTYPGMHGVLNGNRQFRMNLRGHIPSFVFIAGRRAHVRYYGQPWTCFRCGEVGHTARECDLNNRCTRCLETGHTAKDCSSDIVCTLCSKEGHIARRCPSSYSAKVNEECDQIDEEEVPPPETSIASEDGGDFLSSGSSVASVVPSPEGSLPPSTEVPPPPEASPVSSHSLFEASQSPSSLSAGGESTTPSDGSSSVEMEDVPSKEVPVKDVPDGETWFDQMEGIEHSSKRPASGESNTSDPDVVDHDNGKREKKKTKSKKKKPSTS